MCSEIPTQQLQISFDSEGNCCCSVSMRWQTDSSKQKHNKGLMSLDKPLARVYGEKSTIRNTQINHMIPNKGIVDESQHNQRQSSTHKVKEAVTTSFHRLSNILRVILMQMVRFQLPKTNPKSERYSLNRELSRLQYYQQQFLQGHHVIVHDPEKHQEQQAHLYP